MGFRNIKYLAFKRRASRVHFKCRNAVGKRLRLSMFVSNKHMYLQLIDDDVGVTVYSSSTVSKGFRSLFSGKLNKEVVLRLADFFVTNLPVELRGSSVVFDRGGRAYAGNIKIFADAVRLCLRF